MLGCGHGTFSWNSFRKSGNFFPDSIYNVLPGVRELLDKMGDRYPEKARQKQQEVAEGKQDNNHEGRGKPD